MRGGKREGAGRKPASPQGVRVHIAARVLPSTEQTLKEIAAMQGMSLGAVLDMIVERL